MSVRQPSWWINLLSAAKADPKKAGILGVLSLILLVMAGRLVLTGRTTPAGANASPAESRVQVTDGSQNWAGKSIAKRAGSPKSMQEWLTSGKKPLGDRNLFSVRLEYFPRDVKTPTASRVQGEGFWDEVAKSLPSQADQKKERQILIENLQLKAADLRLQTTVMGGVPKALVNDELVKEGDVVASGSGESRTPFRVVKIEPRRIIVEREGIKLEIPMK